MILQKHIIKPLKDWNRNLDISQYKYLVLGVTSIFKNECLDKVLLYIGNHSLNSKKSIILSNEEKNNLTDTQRLILAYKLIKQEIKYYYSKGISSKEISSIRKSYNKLFGGVVVKIPYKMLYLFATIYDIIKEIYEIKKVENVFHYEIRQNLYGRPYDLYIAEHTGKENIPNHNNLRKSMDVQLHEHFKYRLFFEII